jgi:hypothetical protein
MSGYTDAFENGELDAGHAFDFVQKPFTAAELRERVRQAVLN